MNKKEFRDYIKQLKKLVNRSTTLKDLGVCLTDYDDDFYTTIYYLQGKIFSDEQNEIVWNFCTDTYNIGVSDEDISKLYTEVILDRENNHDEIELEWEQVNGDTWIGERKIYCFEMEVFDLTVRGNLYLTGLKVSEEETNAVTIKSKNIELKNYKVYSYEGYEISTEELSEELLKKELDKITIC